MTQKQWKPQGAKIRNDRSELHLEVRAFLHKTFPADIILEEVPIDFRLFLDFYLPNRKMAIEAHGRQHFEYTRHFHGDITGFVASKRRDNIKEQWCFDNNITLIIIRYDDDPNKWIDKFL